MSNHDPMLQKVQLPPPEYSPPTYGAGPLSGRGTPILPNATAGNINYPSATPQYPTAYPQLHYSAGYNQGQSVMVTSQPLVVMAPMQSSERDYLGYSIFTMLCCCFPLGAVALIFSVKTRDANLRGAASEALSNSRLARTLNHVALGLGLAVIVALVAYMVIGLVIIRSYVINYSNSTIPIYNYD